MKEFKLRFTQDVIYSVEVLVKAENEVEAIAKALGSDVWEKQVCNFKQYKAIHETGMMLQRIDGEYIYDLGDECPVFMDGEIGEDWLEWARAYLARH